MSKALQKLAADSEADFHPKDREQALKWIERAEKMLVAGDIEIRISHLYAFWLINPKACWASYFNLKRVFSPSDGIQIDRSGFYANDKSRPDHESMSILDIAEAPDPDTEYFWLVRAYRGIQSFFGTIVGWLTGEKMALPDVWGHVRVRYHESHESILLEWMPEPMKQWNIIKKKAHVIKRGINAVRWLQDHPSMEEMIHQEAVMQVLLKMYMEAHEDEIRAKYGKI